MRTAPDLRPASRQAEPELTPRPTRHRRKGWVVAASVATAVALLAVITAPPDAVQGGIQKLMYVHVPVAWCAYLCFFLVLAGSIWYLGSRSERAQRLSRSAAELGVGLTAITLISGSIWGKATWGTWWVWDARLSATAAMLLVYLGYLAARGVAASARGARNAAIVGIVGFAVVPLVHFSVLWWRTLHQPPTLLAPSLSPPIDLRMGIALFAAVVACTILTVWLLRSRMAALQRRAGGSP